MFRKVDPIVLKETRFIAAVVLILSVLMQAVFLMIGRWHYTVVLGNLWGAALAVGNFFLMGLAVQKNLAREPEEARKKMKLSAQGRLLLLLIGGVIGVALIPKEIRTSASFSVLLPLLFPRIGVSIRGLMLKDK